MEVEATALDAPVAFSCSPTDSPDGDLGFPKTALSHLLTAAAINLIRIDAFLEGKTTAKTRISRFATLAPVELAG